jgi:hypothetical protein
VGHPFCWASAPVSSSPEPSRRSAHLGVGRAKGRAHRAGAGPQALARVLYYSAGITKVKRSRGGDVYFRAAPDTGALHHVDLYLACRDLPDPSAGIYHSARTTWRLGACVSVTTQARSSRLPASSRRWLYVRGRQLLSGEIGLARGLELAEADAWIDEQLRPIAS